MGTVRWAVAILLASTAAAANGLPGASAAPVQVPTVAPATTVTMIVTGCDGCTIRPQRAINPDSVVKPHRPTYWNGRKAVVTNGRATLVVPRAYTAGMSFTISAPWEGGTGFVANIVLGDSATGGTVVTPADAEQRSVATACWAGTRSARATINVTVTQATVEGYGSPATAALAWASPTVATEGPMSPTTSGVLGNQEAFYC